MFRNFLSESGFSAFIKDNMLLAILIGVFILMAVIFAVSALIHGIIKKRKKSRKATGVVAPPTPRARHTSVGGSETVTNPDESDAAPETVLPESAEDVPRP